MQLLEYLFNPKKIIILKKDVILQLNFRIFDFKLSYITI
jgi:hypothetical protein